ncbi:MAG TPA: gamma-glutamyl-gamma-aminobutyrate hydrolase family protein [Blastocatellia bacterium]|nr:gamma-glutamyl-gamma-aminobutyrate hydrolase family protein [Blastocatellia bacterium]
MTEELRPVVAIPCRYDFKTHYYNLREGYPEVLFASGATPVLLPLIPERAFIDSALDRVDAILLSGSDSDVDPLRYGREPKPKLGPVVPRRDETDMMLLAAAEARRIPVLGICFGIQSMNVYRGGTLIQDIPTEVKDPVKHEQGDVQPRHDHSVTFTEGSLLARLAGSTRAAVNSHHHQAVENVGKDLEPIAWAADGVVESVINTRPDQFMLAVQWHPELGWQTDPLSQAIFRHFVEVARTRIESRRKAGAGS